MRGPWIPLKGDFEAIILIFHHAAENQVEEDFKTIIPFKE